jgi:23S rRNA (guanosine2251-2'-O)-methyltransferase
LIFGRNPVLEYLKSAKNLSGTLYMNSSAHGKIMDVIRQEARKRGINVVSVDKDEIAKMHDSASHQGVVLRIKSSDEALDEKMLIQQTVEKKGIIVLLDQLTDPHNIGAIIRTAEALGARGVVMPRAHAPVASETIAKTSAGATAHLPVITVANAARFIEDAKDAGLWVVGSDDTGTTGMDELSSIRPAILVIGNEGTGMRRLTAEKCDYIVRIPLKGRVSSLNASVAAGILIYEMTGDSKKIKGA